MRYMRRCTYCSSTFQSDEKRRLFCSDICRTRYNRDNEFVCFYCGDVATDRDHITPHSTGQFPTRSWRGLDYVNCCSECNTLMGNFHPYSLGRRIRRLIDRFARIKGLNKGKVQWDEDELEELGPELRRQIRAEQEARDRNEARVAHMRNLLLEVEAAEDEILTSGSLDAANDNEEDDCWFVAGPPSRSHFKSH